MALVIARICGPWTGSGTYGNEYRPMVFEEYQVQITVDVVGQANSNIIPPVNCYIADCVMDEIELDLIEADDDYTVFWSEPYAS